MESRNEMMSGRLRATVEAIATRSRSALGDAASRAKLMETQNHLATELRAMGYEPRLEPIEWNPAAARFARYFRGQALTDEELAGAASAEWTNIIVEIKGVSRPEAILLIGAHFDSVSTTPGADDNASAVAALLETARALHGRRFETTVRLVFFNLEEAGLGGSRHHAARAVEERENIIGMVSLEMLGYYSDAPGSQATPIPRIPFVFNPPRCGDFLAVVGTWRSWWFSGRWMSAMRRGGAGEGAGGGVGGGAERGEDGVGLFLFRLLPGAGKLLPDARRSDHAPFLDAGYPALMLTDTANFRNPNYHRETDTPDTLDYARLAHATEAIIAAVVTIAGEIDAE